ncbi:hypothetical protein O0L34_g6244 [Tuta absoluta]|nr:hypothetical protein O0L34_g6244 [Tuta absoluta]
MASKTDIVRPKLVRVYELDHYEKLLRGIKVAACMLTESTSIVDEQSVIKRLNALTLNGASDGNACSCCGVGPFKTRAEQTAHYKHHWHTHNLKRKLFGKTPVTFANFNSRQEDDSSVSGSDSEAEDTSKNPSSDLFAAATRHCKGFFTNQFGQVFCIYRCILHNRKEVLSSDGDGSAWIERVQKLTIPGFQRWAVFMVSGGHFAGGVFSGSACVLHKTLHAYVTRRGQGQSQEKRDQHGPGIKSAGASLRRYNQAQFLGHVQEIVASWEKDLVDCYLILYRAVGSTNQAALFGKNSPINRDDPRVRALPFPTRKPTFKEVLRAHETVASVEVYDTMELFQRALIASTSCKTVNKTGSDTSVKAKAAKSPKQPIDRAKSRERAPRELPTQASFSSDEGPCFIDSETPVGWIKTLSEQSKKGVITNSRKDLLINDSSIASSERKFTSDKRGYTHLTFNSDEGPCFIESETPVGWIKTLSEQSKKGVITNSRKDLLINDSSIASSERSVLHRLGNPCRVDQTLSEQSKKGVITNSRKDLLINDSSIASSERSDSEEEDIPKKGQITKKKKKKKPPQAAQPDNSNNINNNAKKAPQKIPANIKKMWTQISGKENISLETILEAWEGDLTEACNIQDPSDGNTALHKAAIAAKPSMVTELLTAGGDPCIKNHLLQTPYAASPHNETRVAFRLFQAQFPDKYNYAKSQIPGPLTPELLEQERERKAQQKRAKRQREKEKQAEKNKTNKFLLMTDAQKVKADEPRCFLCGNQLPRSPFEYNTFRFCSIRCLQNHRNLRPLHMSA